MVLGPLQGPGSISEFPQVKYFFNYCSVYLKLLRLIMLTLYMYRIYKFLPMVTELCFFLLWFVQTLVNNFISVCCYFDYTVDNR